SVTLIYETAGVYLTVLGKALDSGTEGDIVNVMNLQSKRTVSGVVVGRGRVAIVVASRPEAVEPKLQDRLSDSTSSPGAVPAAV
ncbi:flagella basal body P-ring formation protein FlgA, partial [Acinetobacter baumannii]